MIDKKEYQPPTVQEVGNIEDLTQASGAQNRLDANFPAGTPFGDLTFS